MMTKRIPIAMSFLTGLGMMFIGARFLLSPETAETGYGLHFSEQGDYSFHYIKGVRDIFSGLLICIFVLLKEKRALAFTLLTGATIPSVDTFIVLTKSYNSIQVAVPHITAIVSCTVLAIILLTSNKPKTNENVTIHKADSFGSRE